MDSKLALAAFQMIVTAKVVLNGDLQPRALNAPFFHSIWSWQNSLYHDTKILKALKVPVYLCMNCVGYIVANMAH